MSHTQLTVEIIGAPSDLGANIRGACIGPKAIRIAGLHEKLHHIGVQIIDQGDIEVPIRENFTKAEQENKFLGPITHLCRIVAKLTFAALGRGHIPILLGGDHSLAIGSISAASEFYKKQNKKLGLVWVDAHADLNTPDTSPSKNIHGMPLSCLLGNGYSSLTKIAGNGKKIDANNVFLIGIRTLDALEKEICKNSGINYYTMREIDERGLSSIMNDVLKKLKENVDGIHVSFDIDGVDPLYAPGVSTPVTGGISYREAHLILEIIADTKMLSSLDIMELNPIQDSNQKTAAFAVELIQSALGKSIL